MWVAIKFFGRIVVVWGVAFLLLLIFWNILFDRGLPGALFLIALAGLLAYLVVGADHWRRVSAKAGRLDGAALANRQQRHIEVPFPAAEAFALLETSVRQLPNVARIVADSAGLHLTAEIQRVVTVGKPSEFRKVVAAIEFENNLLEAWVQPNEGTASISLICEPSGGVLADWLIFDGGTNRETAETVTRNLASRISTLRRDEKAVSHAHATQKELAEARLGLLHAQIEPHFLYNTLGSAKYLIRSDPVRAEAMVDNLISYLRHSLPRLDDAASTTLGDELTRARAYLDIMQIRMGPRLALQINVPEALESIPFPPMMLQTLVENAIKHGLEPKPAGGTVWLFARTESIGDERRLMVTVADDGMGMTQQQVSSGIGHANIRERLALAYKGRADFVVTANFPSGLAATIRLPLPNTDLPKDGSA
jgi:signal transduction histidine kinase